jgi:hypothetical protein
MNNLLDTPCSKREEYVANYNKNYYLKNKGELNTKHKNWYKNNRSKVSEQHIKKKYNLSPEALTLMLQEQNNRCAICKVSFDEGFKVNIDHSHKTGKVRGLLCKHCNTALGSLKENVGVLMSAINYLKKYE